jgi:hypothetical protein
MAEIVGAKVKFLSVFRPYITSTHSAEATLQSWFPIAHPSSRFSCTTRFIDGAKSDNRDWGEQGHWLGYRPVFAGR